MKKRSYRGYAIIRSGRKFLAYKGAKNATAYSLEELIEAIDRELGLPERRLSWGFIHG